MLYLCDKGNSLDLVEEATLYHHARLWATVHKDGSFDFHNGRTIWEMNLKINKSLWNHILHPDMFIRLFMSD